MLRPITFIAVGTTNPQVHYTHFANLASEGNRYLDGVSPREQIIWNANELE
jgi:hypothetical protein